MVINICDAPCSEKLTKWKRPFIVGNWGEADEISVGGVLK